MDDREMLELAAKAAGITYWRSKHGYINLVLPSGETVACCTWWTQYDPYSGEKIPEPTLYDALQDWGNFNILEDDGEALRLAVKLRIFLDKEKIDLFAYLFGAAMVDHDEETATRLAIAQVAAAIGKEGK